jgi:hypothetical protein
MDELRELVLEAYERTVGLELSEVAVGSHHKAPLRRREGRKEPGS